MYPQAYVDFLHYFHCDRDYFECHEVLEEHWKEREANERELHWVGLIQIAVGLYHHRRGNFNGAQKMLKNAVKIINKERTAINKLGLDSEKTVALLSEHIQQVEKKEDYKSFNLPITDSALLTSCMKQAKIQNKHWGSPSDLSNDSLINRHSTRNREDVINERLVQLMKRQQSKEKEG
ncbi:DUF309 domain-containing protein [Sutcliffiella halmapala]|uniref:DUF309 domain-containing protein n=1 Tax=Sutcliffiella halmapala TaxID=79882 RepID=UPI0009953E3D|nr:DUF309 domain-containing protein [Sutcliffiella halmapala]